MAEKQKYAPLTTLTRVLSKLEPSKQAFGTSRRFLELMLFSVDSQAEQHGMKK